MGNVNGREDGGGSPSAAEEESGGGSVQEGHAHGRGVSGGGDGSSELMGQSPPHSPRATHSPLMFTPQVPVVPLQRPDEIHIPNNSWMQTSGFEDMCCEQGIPTMITWSYGGKDVAVEGSWDNWKTRMALQRSGKDFTIMKVLPSGVYQYRFIVDGQWRFSPDLPLAQDDAGNSYNLLDLQDYVPEDIGSISGFEPPQSPDSSYNNLQLGSEDFAKEPPLVPPHLQMTLLNAPVILHGDAATFVKTSTCGTQSPLHAEREEWPICGGTWYNREVYSEVCYSGSLQVLAEISIHRMFVWTLQTPLCS